MFIYIFNKQRHDQEQSLIPLPTHRHRQPLINHQHDRPSQPNIILPRQILPDIQFDERRDIHEREGETD